MLTVALIYPISFDHLVTWSRQGVQCLPWEHGAWAQLDDSGRPILTSKIKRKIAASMPVYEDDLEVIFVKIEDPAMLAKHFEKVDLNYLPTSFSSVSGIYPISNRGDQLLRGKMGDILSALTDAPLIIDEIYKKEAEILGLSRINAGELLLRAIGFEYPEKLNDQLMNDVLDVLKYENKSGNELVRTVLTYARQNIRPPSPPIPWDDSGFLSDLGRIISESVAHLTSEDKKVLKKFQLAINDLRQQMHNTLKKVPYESIHEVVEACHLAFANLNTYCKPLTPLAIIVFLKAREILTEEAFMDQNDETKAKVLIKMAEDLKKINKSDVALGIWIVGAVEGYSAVSGLAFSIKQIKQHLIPELNLRLSRRE